MQLKKVELENLKLDLPPALNSSKSFLLALTQITFPENLLVMKVEGGVPINFLVARSDENIPRLKFDGNISDPRFLYAFRLSQVDRLFQVTCLLSFLEFLPQEFLSWSAYFAKADCESLFPLHSDDHDVFVFQLFGERIWKVGNEIFHLKAGDLLKIPRTIEHVVLETKSDSLHITVGNHVRILE